RVEDALRHSRRIQSGKLLAGKLAQERPRVGALSDQQSATPAHEVEGLMRQERRVATVGVSRIWMLDPWVRSVAATQHAQSVLEHERRLQRRGRRPHAVKGEHLADGAEL